MGSFLAAFLLEEKNVALDCNDCQIVSLNVQYTATFDSVVHTNGVISHHAKRSARSGSYVGFVVAGQSHAEQAHGDRPRLRWIPSQWTGLTLILKRTFLCHDCLLLAPAPSWASLFPIASTVCGSEFRDYVSTQSASSPQLYSGS